MRVFFEELSHNQRIDCVDPDSRRIPRRKWWEFSSYLNRNDAANARWGLEQSHTEPRDGLRVCKHDDAPVDKLPVENRLDMSLRSMEKEQTEHGFWWRSIWKFGLKRTLTQGEAETESDEQTRSEEIVQCETDRDDCMLNRQAFVKYGRKCVTRGSGNENQLDSDINRVLSELGVSQGISGDPTPEEDGSPPPEV